MSYRFEDLDVDTLMADRCWAGDWEEDVDTVKGLTPLPRGERITQEVPVEDLRALRIQAKQGG